MRTIRFLMIGLALCIVGSVFAVPIIQVNPEQLNFGMVVVGTVRTMELVILNVGDQVLIFSTRMGGAGFDAPIVNQEDIAPGGEVVYAITFAPREVGMYEGHYVINSNDPRRPAVRIGLFGHGTPAGEGPQINVPNILEFGLVPVGDTVTRPLTVSNVGGANLIISLTVEGGEAFFAEGWNDVVIPPNSVQNFHIAFTPPAVGIFEGVARIESNDEDNPVVEVELRGQGGEVGGQPIIHAPEVINFGEVPAGEAVHRNLIITNAGNADLIISAHINQNAVFFFEPFEHLIIPPRGQGTFTVGFLPPEPGEYNGEIVINSNDPEHPEIGVRLLGVGIGEPDGPRIDVPRRLDFGAVVVGETVAQGLIIHNIGNADLLVSAILESDIFGIDEFDEIVLPPHTQETLPVFFTPPAVGRFAAELVIQSNDPQAPEIIVELVGVGAEDIEEPRIEVPRQLAFGEVLVGEERTLGLRIANVGNQNLTVHPFLEAPAFRAPLEGFNVAPRGVVELPVTFAPDEMGHYTASLILETNDPMNPEVEVLLTGHGVQHHGDLPIEVPDLIDFGNVPIGDEVVRELVISNISNMELSLNVHVEGAGFFADPLEMIILLPEQQIVMPIVFEPREMGVYEGEAIIHFNTHNIEDVVVHLVGRGGMNEMGPRIDLSQHHFEFGEVAVGEQATQELVISNIGNALLLAEASLESEVFEIPRFERINLEPGDEFVLPITFTPTEVAFFEGLLVIHSNDRENPELGVDLAGRGVEGGHPEHHFEPVPPTGLPYIIVIDNATLDEEPLHFPDEIGIFDGDLCVGFAIIGEEMPLPITVWQGAPEQELPGFTPGNPISYLIWSAEEQSEYQAQAEYIQGDGTFGFGVYSQITLHGYRTILMTFPLNARYFELISFFGTPDNLNAESIFGGLEHLEIVYQNNGDILIPPPININTIMNIKITQGYQVFCSQVEELVVEGYPLDPATEYSIESGYWNWLGYPLPYELPVNVALAPIVEQIEIVLADDGRTWIPELQVNTMGNMNPGEGYMIFVHEDVTFQYHLGHWEAAGYDNPVYSPTLDGMPQANGLPYVVAVRLTDALQAENPAIIELYDGDLLVGKGLVQDGQDRSVVIAWGAADQFDIRGFRRGNPISLVVNAANGEEIATLVLGETPIFGKGAYADVRLDRQTVELPASFVMENAYPNPFNPSITAPFFVPQTGKVTITVFNVLGQKTYEMIREYEAGNHQFVFDASTISGEMVSGMYFLQMRYAGQVQTQKLLLIK